ncbi:MAG: hypothetical protein J5379_09435 [Clostridiales bacterium]|nr:hypothetical protein [Clostridiales bacterium]
MENQKENKIELMMVQLLFRTKPPTPTAERFRDAMTKYFGDLGDAPYVEPSKNSTGDMFMFPLPNHKVILESKPEGVPVIAAFLSAMPESGIQIDNMKRQQFWDVPNGNDIIDECTHTVLVNTVLGAALPYQEQAEILLAQVDAALECYPDCTGLYVFQSGKLITPEMFRAQRKFSLSERFIQLFVNAR